MNTAQEAIEFDAAMDLLDGAAKFELEQEGETSLDKVKDRLMTLKRSDIFFLGNEVEVEVSVRGTKGSREVVLNKWSGIKLLQSNGLGVGYVNKPNRVKVSYAKTPLLGNGVYYEPVVHNIKDAGMFTRADLVDAAAILLDFGLIEKPMCAFRDAPLTNPDMMLGFYRPDNALNIVEQDWGINKS